VLFRSPALRALITACLTKDPARRPTPREILTQVGPAGGESTMALRPAVQWPNAAEATHMAGPAPAATHQQAAYPPTRVHPTHSATQLGSTQSPPPGRPSPPTVPADAPSGSGPDGSRRSRRAFLLSGAGAVAAIGVGAGFWLNRSAADKEGAEGGSASPTPSPSAPRLVQPIGSWPLDEASGALARDTVRGNDGTATDIRWRAGKGGAAEFDGTRSQIVTEGPAVRTGAGRSFTVAAWVCLSTEPGFFATAVSQEAADASGFYLQYSSDEKRWAFARPGLRAVGYSVPAVDTWTQLVGVCDGPHRKLRLYVNGVQEAETDDTKPIPAPGGLMIGRATFDGQPSDFFPGAIRDVRVFDRALTSARIKTLK
jgi:hypothetical protein